VRTITRLQRRRAAIRRELKRIDVELRVEKKHLRAITNELANRRPDVAPLRVFGDAVGIVAHADRAANDE